MRYVGSDQDRGATAEDYLRLLAREPNSLRFAEYAEHLRRHDRLSEAMAVCEHGLGRHPAYATGHVVMAMILTDAGLPQQADERLREALRLDPRHPRAHLQLGELLLNRGDRQGAAAEFEAALIASPGLVEAQAKLAQTGGRTPDQGPQQATRGADEARKAGERPAWLTAAATPALADIALAQPGVTGASVADADGGMAAPSRPGEEATGTAAAVELVSEARSLLSRLGAGRLRSVVLLGGPTNLAYLPLGELVLLATLRSGNDVDETIERLDEAITAGPTPSGSRAGG